MLIGYSDRTGEREHVQVDRTGFNTGKGAVKRFFTVGEAGKATFYSWGEEEEGGSFQENHQ